MAAALGFVLRIEAEMDEGVVSFTGFHDDVAALAAVAAGRTAARNELLAAEGHAAIPAVTGFDSDFGFVDEHGENSLVVASVFGRPSSAGRVQLEIPASWHRPPPTKENASSRRRGIGRACTRLGIRTFLLRFTGSTITNLPMASLVHELDAAADLGKQGIVFAATDVEAGFTRVPR